MKLNMTKSIIQWAVAVLLLAPLALSAQVTVGGTTPDPSAVVDMQSTDKGFLWPRQSTSERNAISSPATGLIIFNTNTLCIEINQGTPAVPQWEQVQCRTGIISSLNCAGASVTGLTINIPYTGGNGGVYDAQSAASTGITGLSATLPAGNYADVAGSLSWLVSGVPSGSVTATFSLSSGGFSCSVPFSVVAGSISALDCAGSTTTGTLTSGQAASGVSASVPYTGGNGGFHSGQTVTSTGVTGLTATLSAGGLNSGAGTLTYTVSGTPSSDGTASFALSIGGQTCTLNMTVASPPVCRAKVNATDYRNFMCYNLGAASTSVDPFTPTWEINGGYWQWGRSAEAAAGPTATDPKDGAVSGWNTTNAANGSWADGTKTVNDPCPAGYRVPTKAQWDGVVDNNTLTTVGTFNYSETNYGAGLRFGDQLMLPAVGYRDFYDGTLYDRGSNGLYWSSTEIESQGAWHLIFSSNASTYDLVRTTGYSIRCIEDIPGSIGALDCAGSTITGTLNSGQAASGVSASVPYTGGDAGPHSGQTVASTGVTGLTATLNAGSFISGAGSLLYAITGTPASVGTASFALNIGGQTCILDVTVSNAPVCRAKVTATEYKNFMCYNLGSASTSADPFTPSWEINGGYWQWGRSAQAAEGPTASDPKDGAVSGWNTTDAANDSWTDGSKTANDPCPAGYRVPTSVQWSGVLANNTITNVGAFNASATNYGAGKKFGNQLMLPAAGFRSAINGTLVSRGSIGYYWSSKLDDGAELLTFNSSSANTLELTLVFGLSIRCIEQ